MLHPGKFSRHFWMGCYVCCQSLHRACNRWLSQQHCSVLEIAFYLRNSVGSWNKQSHVSYECTGKNMLLLHHLHEQILLALHMDIKVTFRVGFANLLQQDVLPCQSIVFLRVFELHSKLCYNARQRESMSRVRHCKVSPVKGTFCLFANPASAMWWSVRDVVADTCRLCNDFDAN